MNQHVQQQQTQPARLPAIQAGARPVAIVPATLEDAFRMARYAVESGLTPAGLDTPEKALVAILHGLEIGLPPMTALQRIAVINGRPTIWGDAAIGLVRNSGKAEYIKEWCTGDINSDDWAYHCESKRVDEPNVVSWTFSVRQAKKARLWDTREKVTRYKKGGGGTYEAANDSPWFRFPERMLQMRARGYVLRDLYADVLLGLYLKEEIEGDDLIDITPGAQTAEERREELTAKLDGAEGRENLDAGRVAAQIDATASGQTAEAPDYDALIEAFRASAAALDDTEALNAFVSEFGTRDGEEWWGDAPSEIQDRANAIAEERYRAIAAKASSPAEDAGDPQEEIQQDDGVDAAEQTGAAEQQPGATNDNEQDDATGQDQSAGRDWSEILAEFQTLCDSCKTAEQLEGLFSRASTMGGWYFAADAEKRALGLAIVERARKRFAPPVDETPAAKPNAARAPQKKPTEPPAEPCDPQLLASAKDATKKGLKRFKMWTGSLAQRQFDQIKPHMKELEKAAKEADAL